MNGTLAQNNLSSFSVKCEMIWATRQVLVDIYRNDFEKKKKMTLFVF